MKSKHGNYHFAEEGENVYPYLRMVARDEAELVLLEWIYQATIYGEYDRADAMRTLYYTLD